MMPEAMPPAEARTVAALHAWGRMQLRGEDARRESELLLGHALRRERAWLFAHADEEVADAGERACFAGLVAARARGVPVAQLLGHWGFWTLELRITSDTLVPRAETELLVEAALQRIAPGQAVRVADLGTGSGAIALALAHSCPAAQVLATDASAAALAVARENAATHELHNVEFRRGDWYAPLGDERFDLLLSNPPYIAQGDPHLLRGDLRYEPIAALASGLDGLDALRVLAAGACDHLRRGGWLLVEHGFEQGAAVRGLFAAAGLAAVATLRDLEGRERVTLGQYDDD